MLLTLTAENAEPLVSSTVDEPMLTVTSDSFQLSVSDSSFSDGQFPTMKTPAVFSVVFC